MVLIKEKKEKLLNYFSASMLVGIGVLLLSFLSNLFSFIITATNIYLPFDYIVMSLLILFVCQITGVFIIYYILIPLFKVKKVKFQKLNNLNSMRTILLFCATYAVINVSIFILSYIFGQIDPNLLNNYNSPILSPIHLTNPLNIIIYYLPLTVGAALFEELLYRRTLIPTLENRGMDSSFAILTSGILFMFAHLPEDLISANVMGIIMHLSAVLITGVSIGLIYVITRNVIYSIMVHALLNFLSFSEPIVGLISNSTLFVIYYGVFWTINIIGFSIIVYCLRYVFSKRRKIFLLRTNKNKPSVYGLFGLLSIGLFSVFIPIILNSFVLLGITLLNALNYYLVLMICDGGVLFAFFWMGSNKIYLTGEQDKIILMTKGEKYYTN